MNAPPFEQEDYDLIWSEGAIYIIGFEKGLKTWRPFLKRNDYIAVTHISWLTETHSRQSSAFWNDAYPAICGIDENISILMQSGYRLVGHFPLPLSDWWDEYYGPMEERIAMMKVKYAGVTDAQTACDESQKQIDLWKDHGSDYGYVFYIAQKTG